MRRVYFPFLMIGVVILVIFSSNLFLWANDTIQKAEVFSSGVYVDKEHKEGSEFGEQVESKFAWKQDFPGIKSWCYANSWIGDVWGSLRVFHFKGFRFRNIKPGTRFKANVKFKVALYGLINTTSFAFGDTHYKAKITAGILEGSEGSYGLPLAEVLLWARTNKKEWSDWGQDLLWTAAGEILGEAAGELGGVAVGVLWDAAQYALDALDVDEAIAQEAWVEFKDFPVEAGKDYRVYVSLDSYVACVGIAAGTAHAYIDFFNRAPHEGDDGGKILPLRGIGVKDVIVEIPQGLPYPEGVGPNRPDLTIKSINVVPEHPRINESVSIKAVVTNKGAMDASRFSLLLKHNDKILLNQTIESLKKGESNIIQSTYKITRTGMHKFTVLVDPENDVDELDERNNSAYKSISVEAKPDLLLQYKDVPFHPDALACGINPEGDAFPQVGKFSQIWAKIYNFGNVDALNVKVRVEEDGKAIDQVIIPRIKRGAFKLMSVRWMPKRDGKHRFKIIVDPDSSIAELDESNNSLYLTAEVNLPDYDLSLHSLKYRPTPLKAEDKVNFLLEVSNRGRLDAPVDIYVYINSQLIKHISADIPAGKTTMFGDGKPEKDKIVWEAKAGVYTVKAVIKTRKGEDFDEADNSLSRRISVPEFLPVRGVDFVLRRKDVSFDGKIWKVRVYNRGTESAPATVQFKVFYPEEGEVRSEIVRTFVACISPGGHHDFCLSYSRKSVFKMEITVDPSRKVAERNESNNTVIYLHGDFEKKVEEMRQQRQKEEEMRKRGFLEITRFWGIDAPMKVGEKRDLGVSFKNISGETLKNILIEMRISNTERGDDPKFGAARSMRVWPSVVNKGEFQVLIPYKAVYPGKFKILVKATVYFANMKKVITQEKYFYAKGGEYPPYYYQLKGVDLVIFPQDFKLEPSQKVNAGKKVGLFITVRNEGPIKVKNVVVLVEANNASIYTKTIPEIEAHSLSSFSLSYVPKTPGPLTFKVKVDSNNRIGEVNESNNEVVKQISVYGVWMQMWEKWQKKIRSKD